MSSKPTTGGLAALLRLEKERKAREEQEAAASASQGGVVEEASTTPATPAPPASLDRNKIAPQSRSNLRASNLSPAPIFPKTQVEAGEKQPAASSSFDEFLNKWKQYLRLHRGEVKVLRALFGMTHDRGVAECITTQDQLATAAHLKRRQCINVVNSLVSVGIVERIEIYNNSDRRGLKLLLDLPPPT